MANGSLNESVNAEQLYHVLVNRMLAASHLSHGRPSQVEAPPSLADGPATRRRKLQTADYYILLKA